MTMPLWDAQECVPLPDDSILQTAFKGGFVLLLTDAPGLDTRQLFLKLLEATHVNNLMMRDMLLMQENVEYHLTKNDRQVSALFALSLPTSASILTEFLDIVLPV